jgi:phosphate transport system substrate-binding protein
LTDPPGDASYPILSLSYALLYQETSDAAKAAAIANFFAYGVSDEGQAVARELHHPRLPPVLAARARAALGKLTSHGLAILQ